MRSLRIIKSIKIEFFFSIVNYRLANGICIAPTEPPSTFRITPVHQEPALEAKYMHAPVMSSSLPILPKGVAFAISCSLGPHVFNPADMRDGTNPGARQLTGENVREKKSTKNTV